MDVGMTDSVQAEKNAIQEKMAINLKEIKEEILAKMEAR
jgi:hypothetical protein